MASKVMGALVLHGCSSSQKYENFKGTAAAGSGQDRAATGKAAEPAICGGGASSPVLAPGTKDQKRRPRETKLQCDEKCCRVQKFVSYKHGETRS